MKKVIILAVLALVAGQPKWQDKKAWIYGLQKEFPEKRVTSILGPHSFVMKTSSSTKWYYQDIPFAVPLAESGASKNKKPCHTKALALPEVGWVSFVGIFRGFKGTTATMQAPDILRKAGRPQRPARWIVADWKEPEWDKLPAAPRVRKPQKKPKPPRKLERWEMPKSWQRLMLGLPLASIHRSLGEPMYEERHDTSSAITWYYGNVRECGVISFVNGVLFRWSEPFWPEVERNIYGDKWYEGGTLHKAKMKEWSQASYKNKLATAADFVMGLLQTDGVDLVTVDIDGKIKPMAMDFAKGLDNANEGGIADNLTVAEVAATIWVIMKSGR